MLGRDVMKIKAFVSGPIQGMETRQSYRDVIRESVSRALKQWNMRMAFLV